MNHKKSLVELAKTTVLENQKNRSEYANKMRELRGIWDNSKIGLSSQFGNFRSFVDFAKTGRDFFYAGKPNKVTKKNVGNVISHFQAQKEFFKSELVGTDSSSFGHKETLAELQNCEKKINFYSEVQKLAKF